MRGNRHQSGRHVRCSAPPPGEAAVEGETMSRRLHPCPSCARHLRAGESACPFCEAPLPAGFGASTSPAPAGRPRGRVSSRAALLFFAATAATACGGQTAGSMFTGDGGGRDAAANDGAPLEDAGEDADAMPVVMYGPGPVFDSGPRFDGGSHDASPDAPGDGSPDDASDAGLPVLYGPAPVDAG